jgi:CRISPR-associated endoribonuclease Cas6
MDYCDRLNVMLPDDSNAFTLITGTPIIVRIRREKYDKYNDVLNGAADATTTADQHLIKNGDNHAFIYWRMNHPLDLFITQLEDNLMKKYNEYHGVVGEGEGEGRGDYRYYYDYDNDYTMMRQRNPIFHKFQFKKQIATQISVSPKKSGKEEEEQEQEQQQQLLLQNQRRKATVIGTTWEFMFHAPTSIVQFAIDAGLGELNSMGFGFINLKKKGR